ncbi:TetR/AcrR family transcriptional regulator [Leucobacter denitrificans]|uniref:TetR/AcrR family transcriptional regulator n=1 Tax=Leucobacter denitrificans TaxID=683042 RepID=A0A7G9S536_9MICO|nr:TetR/AcrR family transcriptional regulator [Leucobacter denitrificans]QNN62961.1 TetR/AcrR family transcriptional regulator [Leucobacter denitrificans]
MVTQKSKTPQRRERGSITPDRIIDGAFAVIKESSVESLSMPELARTLDVGVTSIYWYFRKKDDLLRAMSDRAVGLLYAQLPNPEDFSDWRTFIETYQRTIRRILRQDAALADLILIRQNSFSLKAGIHAFTRIDLILKTLMAAGFAPLVAWQLVSSVTTFTNGIVLTERTAMLNEAVTLDDRQTLLITDEMPALKELLRTEEIQLAMVSDDDFETGLSALLDGFERQLTAK